MRNKAKIWRFLAVARWLELDMIGHVCVARLPLSLCPSLYMYFVTVNYRTEFVSCWIMSAEKRKKTATEIVSVLCLHWSQQRNKRCKEGGDGMGVGAKGVRGGCGWWGPWVMCAKGVNEWGGSAARVATLLHSQPPGLAMCEWVHAMGPLKLHSAKNGCARASALLFQPFSCCSANRELFPKKSFFQTKLKEGRQADVVWLSSRFWRVRLSRPKILLNHRSGG